MHIVVSGVCISQGTRQYDITVSSTKVYFDVLQETEIHYYLDKYQPYDKAGAYAIQEWIGINKITQNRGRLL
jgi:septum formation protein